MRCVSAVLLALLVALVACSGADALRARHLTTPAPAAAAAVAPCPAAALAAAAAAEAAKPQEPAVTTTAIDIHAPDAATTSPVVDTAAQAAAAAPAAAANPDNIPVVKDTDVEPHQGQLETAAPLSAPAAAAKPRFAQVLVESESEVDAEADAESEAESELEADLEALLDSEVDAEDEMEMEMEADDAAEAEVDAEAEAEDLHEDAQALAELESAAPAVIRQAWWPAAIKSTKGMKMGPVFTTAHKFKAVLHTTEGGTASGAIATYQQTTCNPHFTVEMSGGKFRAYQHIPITNGARALRHPANTCDTNDANAIQIEIVGSAKKANTFARNYLDGIGSLLKWIKQQTGIPAKAPSTGFVGYPASGGAKAKQRMTCPQWLAFTGVAGHQHVPNNDHGDPGAIDIRYLLSKMA